MQAINELKNEHRAAMLMLEVLEKVNRQLESGRTINPEHLDKILDFFTGFVDRCHYGKEERLLISRLKQAGNRQVQVRLKRIVDEHEQGRRLIQSMKVSLRQYKRGADYATRELIQASSAYVELLKAHIATEDKELFPLADKLLSKSEQENIREGLNNIENEKVRQGQHEEYHQLLKKIRGIYLLD